MARTAFPLTCSMAPNTSFTLALVLAKTMVASLPTLGKRFVGTALSLNLVAIAILF